MKPRRPTLAPLLQRLLLSLLLVVALLAHGAPPGVAAQTVSPVSEAGDSMPPCHAAGDAKQAPAPEKAKTDPFACCATLACGMMFQALPPDFRSDEPAIVSAFARPASPPLPALPLPDPAWRPPAAFL